jgi:hypothetical protein
LGFIFVAEPSLVNPLGGSVRFAASNTLPRLRQRNAHSPPCLKQRLATLHDEVMIYRTGDSLNERELERLRSKRQRYSERQRYAERMCGSHAATPAIKMIVGDWYVDELGVRTRQITARE